MQTDLPLFWSTTLVCAIALIRLPRNPTGTRKGWAFVFAAILAQNAIGAYSTNGQFWIRAAAIEWAVLVLTPGLLINRYSLLLNQQRYRDAHRLARVISCLHPADGWRQQPQIIHALALAQAGNVDSAVKILDQHRTPSGILSLTTAPALFRLTDQWEQMLVWERENQAQIDTVPQLLHSRLRARAEIGDISGMVHLYDQNKDRIAKLPLKGSAANCRLMLFVFCGQREQVARLFGGVLAMIPHPVQKYWLASADLYAGNIESGRQQLTALSSEADPGLRLAIDRRFARCPAVPASLSPSDREIVAAAVQEQLHEHIYTPNANVLSPAARGSLVLIVANCVMYAVETASGGGTNLDVLYRLGAMFWPSIRAGEYWRIFSANFLHFGLLHLAMNALGLLVLGPTVEAIIGTRKFLLIYLLSGMCSLSLVGILQGSHPQLIVGASGAIMGLVGALAAVMLRGWFSTKAAIVRRRLNLVAAIIVMQIAFDLMIPEVSMAAHLSGAVIGFILTFLFAARPQT